LRQTNRTSTPPPEISPTSPSILSSPAHGLDETYKRIAEEEDIAAQEGQLGDEDEYTDDMYQNNDYGYGQHSRPDDDSVANGEIAKYQNGYGVHRDKENVPLEDGTGATHVSDMSFLQGLTDQDLAAKLTLGAVQAAKDRAILAKASQRQTPINFNGVKNGPTLSERLRRKSFPEEDSSRQEELQEPHNNADADDFREPPPNVPKSWAKARPEKSWLSKSRQRREQGRNGAANSPGPDSSQVDWAAAAADIPLPSVEDNFAPGPSSMNSSPATLQSHRSLDRIRTWELNDFTGQSLQVSDSPPVRPRTTVVDQIQQREIERLERQAVTTSRLGQYRQRQDPNILIRKLTRGQSVDTYPTPEPSATPQPSGFHPSLMKAITPTSSSQTPKVIKFTADGESKSESPVVIYRSSSSSSNGTSKQDTRPLGKRKASEDRLARLARAMSNSPKPSSTPEERSLLETEEKRPEEIPAAGEKVPLARDTLIEKVMKENQEAAQRAESSRQSSKEFAEEETTPKVNRTATTAKTPKVTGAWTDTILPDTILRTLRKQENTLHAQTPHVNAGGWIETPAPEGKRQSSALAPIPIEEEEEIPIPEGLTNGISKPPSSPGPQTALASLLARAKARLLTAEGQQMDPSNDTLHLNDSTINSLEDLLTLDNAELTTLIQMGAESEAREQLIRDHLGAEPVAEAQLLERLSGKLQALRSNIHDARRGIGRLESQVAGSPEAGAVVPENAGACRTCGAVGGTRGYLIAITLPFAVPHLFHKRLPGQSLPRPTWLGWVTLLAWGWYLMEAAMGNMYAHPLYRSEGYVWPREPEPRFPFVLPSMVWRCGGRGVWWVCVALFRLVGQAMGWVDGFVDDPELRRAAAAGVEELAGMGMGMEGDVFL
jgi:hypothetical protein